MTVNRAYSQERVGRIAAWQRTRELRGVAGGGETRVMGNDRGQGAPSLPGWPTRAPRTRRGSSSWSRRRRGAALILHRRLRQPSMAAAAAAEMRLQRCAGSGSGARREWRRAAGGCANGSALRRPGPAPRRPPGRGMRAGAPGEGCAAARGPRLSGAPARPARTAQRSPRRASSEGTPGRRCAKTRPFKMRAAGMG